MMVSLGIRLRRWQRVLRRWALNPKTQALTQTGGSVLCGILLSAGSLLQHPLPLTLGLLMSLSGWPAVLIAAGGMAGYLLFWGTAGLQGAAWMLLGLPAALVLNRRALPRSTPWLMPALAGVLVAATGLAGLVWLKQDTAIGIYLLQIGLAILSGRLFTAAADRQDPVLVWLVWALGVLALAQVRLLPWLGLGFIAAGILAATEAFPAAALAGLALDLAQVTPVPMTAVLSLAYLLRLIPGMPRRITVIVPSVVYIFVMGVCGMWDILPLPGLLLGGIIGFFLPPQTPLHRRRGETGFAQVRLELASSVLNQTEVLLETVEEYPIDEEALMVRAAERACGSCPCRKNCREEPAKLPTTLLHKPLGNGGDLPINCRKTGRLLTELRRSQEQFRSIRADRDRRTEYRAAVVQQYRFLSEYLQNLSDALSRRTTPSQQQYQPELAVCSASRDGHNGDRCFWFAGVECRYYILLCDGMGTGIEAAREGKLAGSMLKKLLCAGYPPEYALRSINSFCALRGRAGVVTMDLAELQLDTGKATIYKWGAAPSFLLYRGETIKIGTAAPPPGLSVTEGRETVQRLSLRKGETLILLSDGAGGEESLRAALEGRGEPPGELAARILEHSRLEGADDATVAVVRLGSLTTST